MLRKLLITLAGVATLLWATCVVIDVRDSFFVQTWAVTAEGMLSAVDERTIAETLQRRASKLVRSRRASVRQQGPGTFIVEIRGHLPSEADVGRVLTERGIFELLLVEPISTSPRRALGPEERELPDPSRPSTMLVLSGSNAPGRMDFEDAGLLFVKDRPPILRLQLSHGMAGSFREFSRRNIGRQVALVLDGRIVSAPTIREDMGSLLQVSFDSDVAPLQVRALAAILAGGALPEAARLTASRIDSQR